MSAPAAARSTAPARGRERKRAAGRSAGRSHARAEGAGARARRRRLETPVVGFVPVAAARTAGAVSGLADSGIVVRLTRGRLWIGILATLLVGIVGLNVMALSFNSSSSDAGRAADALERQNSTLRAELADRLSAQEVQAAAQEIGLVFAAPGAIGYLDPSPGDAARAARRLRDGELTATPINPAAATTVPTDPAATAVPMDPAATTVAPTDPTATTAAGVTP